jgi:outer membrane protein TolC
MAESKLERNQQKLENALISAEHRWKDAIKSLNSAREQCETAARDHAACQRDLIAYMEKKVNDGKR